MSAESKAKLTLTQTGDTGIFQTTLSNEYWLAMEHFRLMRRELIELSRGAVECIFDDDGAQKARLRRLVDEFAAREELAMRCR